MTKVRDCTYTDDLDFVMELMQRFNSKHYSVPICLDRLEEFTSRLLDMDTGVVLRTDKGLIAGTLVLDPVRNWSALVELAWYSEGRDGIKLLRAFEERGRVYEADEIRMSHLHSYPRSGELLGRLGYTPVETSHTLKL